MGFPDVLNTVAPDTDWTKVVDFSDRQQSTDFTSTEPLEEIAAECVASLVKLGDASGEPVAGADHAGQYPTQGMIEFLIKDKVSPH